MIHVPFRLLKSFHKVQTRLVRELEKKFSGKDVVIVANRRILPKPTTGAAIARPRSRTLTAVHAALLEDLVYPTEIVGKRTRYLTDGSKLLKVYLDPKDRCAPRSEAAGLGLRLRPVRVALTVGGAQEHDRVQAGQLLPRLQEAHRPCVLLRVPGHHRELEPACGQRHAAAWERLASLQTHKNRKNLSSALFLYHATLALAARNQLGKKRRPSGASSRHSAPCASAASRCSLAIAGARPASLAASTASIPSECSVARRLSVFKICGRGGMRMRRAPRATDESECACLVVVMRARLHHQHAAVEASKAQIHVRTLPQRAGLARRRVAVNA